MSKPLDILTDYELLCEQVQSVLLDTYMAIQGKDSEDTIITFNTYNSALRHLMHEHKQIIKDYHKEMQDD